MNGKLGSVLCLFATICAAGAAPIRFSGAYQDFDNVHARIAAYCQAYDPDPELSYDLGVDTNEVFTLVKWNSKRVPPPVLEDDREDFPTLAQANGDFDEVKLIAKPDGR